MSRGFYAFFFPVSFLILKLLVGNLSLKHMIKGEDKLVYLLSSFGVFIGSFFIVIIFIIIALMIYFFYIMFSKSNIDLSFKELIVNWFSIGFIPVFFANLILYLFFDFFVKNEALYSYYEKINSLCEIFIFVFCYFSLLNVSVKRDYVSAGISIVTPLLIFYIFIEYAI